MKHANLQTKLIARLLIVLLGFGLLFFFSLNHYLRSLMETEVADKGRLILANLIAVQTYVRETLRPGVREITPPENFVIEAMSTSYVTRKVMSDLNTARDQFSYRRVSLEPRNPEYAANDLERELIVHFQKEPNEQIFREFRVIGEEEYYIMARPVVFGQSCLVCHGKPEDAPAVMLSRYGTERGFGRKEGEISGLDMLILPVERERAAIQKVTVTFIAVFVCGTLAILGFNHLFFDRIMIQNIGRLSALLRSRFPDEADSTMRERHPHGDEIENMISDMERFADHLRAMKEQLSDYAANLEQKVEERTIELTNEVQARRYDVQLFLDVIHHFAKGLDRRSLLDLVLNAVTNRFQAEKGVFYCFLGMSQQTWPSESASPQLSESKRDHIMDGTGIFQNGEAVVPVQAPDSVRGALGLSWKSPMMIDSREQEVLLAVGRQLGIALENLEAVENILRQKAVLESIFEGIADPLFLLGSNGAVVHANESADRLMTDLAKEGKELLQLLGLRSVSAADDMNANQAQREIVLPSGRSLVLRGYPLTGYPGVGRTIVYARDNTVEKTMLARMQRSEKALAVGKLAAGLAHEINNPLGVILCYARLLWDNGKSEHSEDLDIIIRHSLQAQKVLQDLMRFARPKPEAMGAIKLADAVAFIARVFQVRAAKQSIKIETEVSANLPAITGDLGALEQILTNLIVNAMDALEESNLEKPGYIRIAGHCDSETKEVVLTIADNGPGIPEENLMRVFDPFFTTKEVGRGTGLGLSVVYGLVRDLGGSIQVENRNGALFTIRFQAVREEHVGTTQA